MRIALATCRDLPDWEVDDRPLHAALRDRNVEIVQPAWDDEQFDWSTCDACLIRTTWDYMERQKEFTAWADRVESQTRLFNSAEIVRWNTHKKYLRDLEQRGAPVMPTIWIDAGQPIDVAGEMAERGWKRGFIKPAIGATARETLRFAADEDGLHAAQAHLDRMLRGEDMLLQPYCESVETIGERSAIFIDGELTHGVRKVPVAGDYRVQDDFGAHDEPYALPAAQRELASGIVASVTEDLLYARLDFLEDELGGWRLTEMEVVEPSLFFRHCPAAAERLADGLLRRIA